MKGRVALALHGHHSRVQTGKTLAVLCWLGLGAGTTQRRNGDGSEPQPVLTTSACMTSNRHGVTRPGPSHGRDHAELQQGGSRQLSSCVKHAGALQLDWTWWSGVAAALSRMLASGSADLAPQLSSAIWHTSPQLQPGLQQRNEFAGSPHKARTSCGDPPGAASGVLASAAAAEQSESQCAQDLTSTSQP